MNAKLPLSNLRGCQRLSRSLSGHIRNLNIHMLGIEASRRNFGYNKLNALF